MIVRGHVKWFDATKGYGFVVTPDDEGDILLHGNVLRIFGFTSVAEGAEVVLRVQSTERGRQAVEVVDVVPGEPTGESGTLMADLPPGAAAGPLEPARVKWFDRVKGFGFVNLYGKPEDVFLHMETLRQYGYGEVVAGDVLAVRVTAGPRGPMVYEVRSWDYVARLRAAGTRVSRLVLAWGLVFGLAGGGAAAQDCAPDVLDLRDGDSTLRFRIEVADTDASRAQGLMHRDAMPRFSGMLFVYPRPGPVAFWMRNTRIPLDMLFFDEAGRLTHVHENAVPFDETAIPGGNDVQFVLEINGGMARELGIDLGAELRHPAVDPDLAVWSCDD